MWTKLLRLARHPIVRKVAIVLLAALAGEFKKPQRKR